MKKKFIFTSVILFSLLLTSFCSKKMAQKSQQKKVKTSNLYFYSNPGLKDINKRGFNQTVKKFHVKCIKKINFNKNENMLKIFKDYIHPAKLNNKIKILITPLHYYRSKQKYVIDAFGPAYFPVERLVFEIKNSQIYLIEHRSWFNMSNGHYFLKKHILKNDFRHFKYQFNDITWYSKKKYQDVNYKQKRTFEKKILEMCEIEFIQEKTKKKGISILTQEIKTHIKDSFEKIYENYLILKIYKKDAGPIIEYGRKEFSKEIYTEKEFKKANKGYYRLKYKIK